MPKQTTSASISLIYWQAPGVHSGTAPQRNFPWPGDTHCKNLYNQRKNFTMPWRGIEMSDRVKGLKLGFTAMVMKSHQINSS